MEKLIKSVLGSVKLPDETFQTVFYVNTTKDVYTDFVHGKTLYDELTEGTLGHKIVYVPNDTTRFALTSDLVNPHDRVVVENLGGGYYEIIDTTKLSSEDGYKSINGNKVSQLDFNNIKKYNTLTVTKVATETNRYIVNPIPKTGWTMTSLTSGSFTASSKDYQCIVDSYSSNGNEPYRAVYGESNINSAWRSGSVSSQHYITLKFPNSIKIELLTFGARVFTTTAFKIQGSNNNTSWTELFSGTNLTTGQDEYTLVNPDFYLYYRISFTLSSNNPIEIYSLIPTLYLTDLYNQTFTIDKLPTDLINNQRIMVEIPSTATTLGVQSNSLIISNDGIDKRFEIDRILEPGKFYELRYIEDDDVFYSKEV